MEPVEEQEVTERDIVNYQWATTAYDYKIHPDAQRQVEQYFDLLERGDWVKRQNLINKIKKFDDEIEKIHFTREAVSIFLLDLVRELDNYSEV